MMQILSFNDDPLPGEDPRSWLERGPSPGLPDCPPDVLRKVWREYKSLVDGEDARKFLVVARRLAPAGEDPEDYHSEVLLVVERVLPKHDGGAKLLTYAFRALDFKLKARRHGPPTTGLPVDFDPSDPTGLDFAADPKIPFCLCLEGGWKSLGEKDRSTILIAYPSFAVWAIGLPVRDDAEADKIDRIADMLGCKKGAARVALHRALEKYRRAATTLVAACKLECVNRDEDWGATE